MRRAAINRAKRRARKRELLRMAVFAVLAAPIFLLGKLVLGSVRDGVVLTIVWLAYAAVDTTFEYLYSWRSVGSED